MLRLLFAVNRPVKSLGKTTYEAKERKRGKEKQTFIIAKSSKLNKSNTRSSNVLMERIYSMGPIPWKKEQI